MLEIIAHPIGGRKLRARLAADSNGGGFRLQFVGKDIVVAALPEMQKAASSGKKLDCVKIWFV